LSFQASEVPPHTNVAGFIVRLLWTPSLKSHSVESRQCAGAIGAAAAMKEDRIIIGVIDELKVFRDSSLWNLRPGHHFVDGNLYVIHSKLFDNFCFGIILFTQINDGFDSLIFQKLKSLTCRLATPIEAICQDAESGNVSPAGLIRRAGGDCNCREKNQEADKTKHWYLVCTFVPGLGAKRVFNGSSFKRKEHTGTRLICFLRQSIGEKQQRPYS